ncbi:ABC transporter permease [Microbulbifer sp. 2205BS26-8]|uniref:ABC transporter permease n=1 Tax=Microbulbifer sp. 2205BS26-8 TaxID=3064386 RepID=UPI00273FA044|nr:ABC transporter permease [Microbulbifer sp. 2205BS26-8]MDP5210033.1 ABC transporter permease [Microbulbifer sp. 2205BS26-8]
MSGKLIWISFSTVLRRELRRFIRIWPQTLVPPVITMSLYFVIFGSLIGSRIGNMDGYPYMEFVVPGLIMMSVITNSYANVASSFYSAKFQRSVEELLVSPTPNWAVMAGYVFGGVARGLMVGLIVTLVAVFFTSLSVKHLAVTVAIVLLAAVLFSLAGFINAIYANSFDAISIIPTFVLTPLTYLGGVFYSIDLLSPFWQGLSKLNPILYMVNSFRFGILGVSDINVVWAFVGVLVFIALLVSWGLYLMSHGKRLRH